MHISTRLFVSAALQVVLAAACSSEPVSDAGAGELERPSAYESLPRVQPVYESPLCHDQARCALPPEPHGAVNSNGDAIVGVSSPDLPPVVLVPAATRELIPIGRRGTGPGEYRSPFAQAFDANGDLLLVDPFARRMLRYSSTGASLQTARISLPPAMAQVGSIGNIADGRMHLLGATAPEAKALPLTAHGSGCSGSRQTATPKSGIRWSFGCRYSVSAR